jgi:hypothetical protein
MLVNMIGIARCLNFNLRLNNKVNSSSSCSISNTKWFKSVFCLASLFVSLTLTSTTALAANGTLTFTSNTGITGTVAQDGQGGSTDAADTTLKPFNAAVTVAALGGGLPIDIRDPYVGMNFMF